jgi:hypothetical protein
MAVDLGEVVPRSVLVRTSTGAPVDADVTPVYSVTLPDGTTGTPPGVAHGVTGEYFVLYPTVQVGMHSDRWVATVAGVTVTFGPDSFRVRAAGPAPLISLGEARQLLGLGVDAERDERVRDYIDSAAAVLERETGRLWRRQTVVEVHDDPWLVIRLRREPVSSITSVVDAGTDVTAQVIFDRLSGEIALRGSRSWNGAVTVTYEAGPTVPPDDALAVARVILQYLWATQGGSSGVPRRATGVDPLTVEVERALGRLRRAGGGL